MIRMALAGIAALLGCLTLNGQEPSKSEPKNAKSVLDVVVKDIDGNEVNLSKYQGQVVLIVNVASKCGLTKQYTELEALYDQYGEKGFVILGFPCNQFMNQEPGTEEEIRKFCQSKYDISFPLFAKISVNGDARNELYQRLTGIDTKPVGAGDISWNFEKFLINRNGEVVGRFAPRTTPNDKSLVAALEEALAATGSDESGE
jgi:glutathione peroxidase